VLDRVLEERARAQTKLTGVGGAQLSTGGGEAPPSVVREPIEGPGGPYTGNWPNTFRVGVAGPPGAGKSTLIEAMGQLLCGWGHKVAVLAIDPSSSRSGGSLLGDRTRMTELSRNPRAFVRPSPTRGALGGVAAHTNDVVLLTEAAGYDIVLVETVGLGQSEVAVDSTVDCLLLVLPPAGGDELQGVKKGIMEVADIVAVNKADGDWEKAARLAALEYRRAMSLIPQKHPRTDWYGEAATVSSLDPHKVSLLWYIVSQFRSEMERRGEISRCRAAQAGEWMWAEIRAQALERIRKDPAINAASRDMLPKLAQGLINPRRAAHLVLEDRLRV
jgi:LAO/AO transport system kinase